MINQQGDPMKPISINRLIAAAAIRGVASQAVRDGFLRGTFIHALAGAAEGAR